MTLIDTAKQSMTRSIVRPLCDSWASCYVTVWGTLWDRLRQNVADGPRSWTVAKWCHRPI